MGRNGFEEASGGGGVVFSVALNLWPIFTKDHHLLVLVKLLDSACLERRNRQESRVVDEVFVGILCAYISLSTCLQIC
jgi:hypothetical protein